MKQKDLVENFPDMRRNFGDTFSDNTGGVTIEIWWKNDEFEAENGQISGKKYRSCNEKKWPTLVKKIAELQQKMANYCGKSSGVATKNGQFQWKKQWSCSEKWPILVEKIAELQRKMANSSGKSRGVAAKNGLAQWKNSGVAAKNGQFWWKKQQSSSEITTDKE